jgi:hypothetical protein
MDPNMCHRLLGKSSSNNRHLSTAALLALSSYIFVTKDLKPHRHASARNKAQNLCRMDMKEVTHVEWDWSVILNAI